MPELTKDSIEVSRTTPIAARVVISVIVFFMVIMVFKDFWRALWPPTLLSLFFVPFFGAALIMGAVVTWSLVFGRDQKWTIQSGHITITETLHNFVRKSQYTPKDFERIEVEAYSWEARSDTYQLVLHRRDKKLLKSPDFETEAQALEAMSLFQS